MDTTLKSSKAKILLMDDEYTVRDVVKRMLTAGGYSVELAENGEEAVAAFQTALQEGNPFDAVILDLIVQNGMDGRSALQKLLEIDPKVKVIIASGYSDDPVMANFKDYGFKAIISKPFTFQQIKDVVRSVLITDN